jgi:hypothetical protein
MVVAAEAVSTGTGAGVVGALVGTVWLAAITLGAIAGWVRLRDRAGMGSRNPWGGWAAVMLAAAFLMTTSVLLTGAAS